MIDGSKFTQYMKEATPKRVLDFLENRGIAYPEIGFSVGDGWVQIVFYALDKMIAVGWDRDLHQVKEKYGGLRLYIGEETAEIAAIIDEAERICGETCESCGAPGTLNTRGWRSTMCDPCRTMSK